VNIVICRKNADFPVVVELPVFPKALTWNGFYYLWQ